MDDDTAEGLVAHLVPLLQDRANKVRQRAARRLRRLAEYVPLEAAARALAEEEHPQNRPAMESLLRAVLNLGGK